MIHRISLAEVLEQSSPPARTLDLSVLDDTAFIRVCDVAETHLEDKHREVVEITVSLPSLIEALNMLALDAERERLRPQERSGAHETRFAGRRLTVAPVAPWSAVAALTEHWRYAPDAEADKPPKTETGGGDE